MRLSDQPNNLPTPIDDRKVPKSLILGDGQGSTQLGIRPDKTDISGHCLGNSHVLKTIVSLQCGKEFNDIPFGKYTHQAMDIID